MHQDHVPEICQRLKPGMVIDLPEERIEQYAFKLLHWMNLPEDTELIENLRPYLQNLTSTSRMTGLDLLTSPFYLSLDSEI